MAQSVSNERQKLNNMQFEMEQRQRRTREALNRLNKALDTQEELYGIVSEADVDRITKEYEDALNSYIQENEGFVKARDEFENAQIKWADKKSPRKSMLVKGAQN